MPRNPLHRGEYAFVADAPGAQLRFNHYVSQ